MLQNQREMNSGWEKLDRVRQRINGINHPIAKIVITVATDRITSSSTEITPEKRRTPAVNKTRANQKKP